MIDIWSAAFRTATRTDPIVPSPLAPPRRPRPGLWRRLRAWLGAPRPGFALGPEDLRAMTRPREDGERG